MNFRGLLLILQPQASCSDLEDSLEVRLGGWLTDSINWLEIQEGNYCSIKTPCTSRLDKCVGNSTTSQNPRGSICRPVLKDSHIHPVIHTLDPKPILSRCHFIFVPRSQENWRLIGSVVQLAISISLHRRFSWQAYKHSPSFHYALAF